MANPAITTVYDGEHIGELLQLMVVGNEAVEKGSFYIHEGVEKKTEITRGTVSENIIQSYQSVPTDPSNALTFNARYLTPEKMMVYDHLRPMEFQNYWREYQPQGPLAEKVLDPAVQRVIVELYQKQIGLQLGKLIWAGNKSTTGALKYVDGIVTKALADSAVIDVTAASNAAITAANIIEILTACEAAVPDALFSDPDMTYHMNTGDFRKYQAASRALANKGSMLTAAEEPNFAGRAIKYYSGLPANSVLVAKGNTNPVSSNLHIGVNLTNDFDNLLIEKWRPESDIWFLKAALQLDVNYAFGQEIVMYTGT